MSYAYLGEIGKNEKISISSSMMQALQRAFQMTELVLGHKVNIVHMLIEAEKMEKLSCRDEHGVYEIPDQVFLFREIRIVLSVTKKDPRYRQIIKSEVILRVSTKTNRNSADSKERKRWTVSNDQNYIKAGDKKPVCVEFNYWDSGIEDYRAKISKSDFQNDLAARHFALPNE